MAVVGTGGGSAIKNMLTGHGHEVVEAASGEEGVTKSQEELPDIVLMDIVMPELNGYEATKLIRAREQTSGRHSTIIAVSTLEGTSDVEKSKEAGMDHFIHKPLTEEKLRTALTSLHIS